MSDDNPFNLPLSAIAFNSIVQSTRLSPEVVAFTLLGCRHVRASTYEAVRRARHDQLNPPVGTLGASDCLGGPLGNDSGVLVGETGGAR